LKESAFRKIWTVWERKPTREKVQFILSLLGKEEIPRGERVFQNAKALVELRYIFVHFQPISDNDITAPTRQLRNKFAPNRFFSTEEKLVPQGCMSYSCFKWAVGSSLEFTQEFLRRTGLKSPFDSVTIADFATSNIN
jgi:hypothetical protein